MKNLTVLGALRLEGLRELMVVEGGTTVEVFAEFAARVLIPSLEPGMVVVLDNLSTHRSQRVVELFGDHSIHFALHPSLFS